MIFVKSQYWVYTVKLVTSQPVKKIRLHLMRYHKEVRHLSFFELCLVTNSFWPECVTMIVSGPRLHYWQLLTPWIFQKLYQERACLLEIFWRFLDPLQIPSRLSAAEQKPRCLRMRKAFLCKSNGCTFSEQHGPSPGLLTSYWSFPKPEPWLWAINLLSAT